MTIPERIKAEAWAVVTPFLRQSGLIDGFALDYAVAVAIAAAEELATERERERCAQIIERDEMDHSIRLDPKRHPNLSDWFREKRVAAIRAGK